MNENDLHRLAGLSWNEYIGPRRYDRILAELGSVGAFFSLSAGEQMDFCRVNGPKAPAIFAAMTAEGGRITDACRRKGIRMVSREDPSYPARLRRIPDAPFLLYQLGSYNQSLKSVAVVGTRNISPDAAEINRHFTRELVSYNIQVISGMAKGHDYISQKTALENSGSTVAVLGSGIDVVYPADFDELYASIAEQGCLFSEYPPLARPDKTHFPIRNRIISGLSDAVLVVQAPEKSGALYTARYAHDQGRDLYAIPGSPSDARNAGSNRLIQQGAKMALSPEEIILDIMGRKAARVRVADHPAQPEGQDGGWDAEERKVMSLLGSETHIDEIAERSGLGAGRLNHVLLKLEMRGAVMQYPGRFYVRAGG